MSTTLDGIATVKFITDVLPALTARDDVDVVLTTHDSRQTDVRIVARPRTHR